MSSQRILHLFLFLTLLLETVNQIEGRGGGRRGGGLFSSWRKVKKPSSSSSSSRRQYGGSNGGSSGSSNKGYTPLKSTSQSKTQSASYPKQQLPAGSTYHASGSSLPAGATYHPHNYYGGGAPGAGMVPPGGAVYANAAAIPPGAVFYAQPPKSSFSPGNFIFGMYAGQMLSHGLFRPRPYAMDSHQDYAQPAENKKDQVIVINNGPGPTGPGAGVQLITGPGVETNSDVTAVAPHFWPTDADVPLAPINSSAAPETFGNNPAETIFKRKPQEALKSSTRSVGTLPIAAQQQPPEGSIICLPLMINETDAHDATKVQQVEKILCYPAPPPTPSDKTDEIPQSAAAAGIICIPRKVLEAEPSETSPAIKDNAQDCYPAPPSQDPASVGENQGATKSPDSVIGNIAIEQETAKAVERQETHAALEVLRQEEQNTMQDFFRDFESKNVGPSETYVAANTGFLKSAAQPALAGNLHALLAVLLIISFQ